MWELTAYFLPSRHYAKGFVYIISTTGTLEHTQVQKCPQLMEPHFLPGQADSSDHTLSHIPPPTPFPVTSNASLCPSQFLAGQVVKVHQIYKRTWFQTSVLLIIPRALILKEPALQLSNTTPGLIKNRNRTDQMSVPMLNPAQHAVNKIFIDRKIKTSGRNMIPSALPLSEKWVGPENEHITCPFEDVLSRLSLQRYESNQASSRATGSTTTWTGARSMMDGGQEGGSCSLPGHGRHPKPPGGTPLHMPGGVLRTLHLKCKQECSQRVYLMPND